MKSYTKEIGVLVILLVLAGAATRDSSFLHMLFGISGSEVTQAIAPQLASQSYVQQSEPTNGAVETADSSDRSGALRSDGATTLFSTTSKEEAPNLLLHGALIADLETGETYYALRSDSIWPIASVTKLMTAAYATQYVGGPTAVTLPEMLGNYISADSVGVLKAGETYTAFDLEKAMLTFSSNEAAEGLASAIGRDAFLKGMNDTATSWGMLHTKFLDPTGLSASNQSTPLDLIILLRRMYQAYPDLLSITRSSSATLTEQTTGRAIRYNNINEFAGRADFLGGKTGYTDEAQGNLVSIFAYENRPIAVIVLGTSDRFGATSALFNWFKRTHTSR